MWLLIGKIARLARRFFNSPVATVKDVPTDIESLRMHLRGNSIFRRPQDLAFASHCPARMLDEMMAIWKPNSVLDVGCGTGKAIDHLLSLGLTDLVGLEGSQLAIDHANQPEKLFCHDLTNPIDLGRKFDVVYSFEVAEHLPPQAANIFVDTLVNHGNRILMTAARPGQGGMGHLNEQEPAYWIEKLKNRGFEYAERDTNLLKDVRDEHYKNIMAFVRRPPGVSNA
ncbi:hypothetical protein Pla22_23150 [Rubripirellula amarantea]|uniref:Bifunctional 3-demethylubiquinone-9 3-methyltransferase/ 2-octaprenyl-6-hydroxy phenol methylase n=1 Tax=Rubripirellula amarantea TaxID=2527999 RepID=A0A5C5WXQ0_9BACT|nr:class I SAM-dependent methyltransferase [Rubripirellula amarantea]TWT54665.1 hypothetical protein Pla22_23150 [Rubripirellula amarantea]